MDLLIPANGYNIPRNQLPQVYQADIPEFLAFIDASSIKWDKVVTPVCELKASQADFSEDKVYALIGNTESRPLLISSDNVILDGHHRWLALYNTNKDSLIEAYRIDLPFFALLNVTKQFPKVFYKSVNESLIFIYGRFQPPTLGHSKLIETANSIRDIVVENGGANLIYPKLRIYVSGSHDSKKNPLLQEDRVRLLGKMFPSDEILPVEGSNGIVQLLSRICEEGFSKVALVCGSDRVDEYHRITEKYNGVNYYFDSISITSGGIRDDNSSSIDGLSGTKMRTAAINGDFKTLREGMSDSLDDCDITFVMDKIKQSINENFDKLKSEFLSEGPQDKCIFKAIFITGSTGSGKDFVLKQTLDGHGLVEIPSEKVLSFLQDKNKLDKNLPDSTHQRLYHKGRSKSLGDLRGRLAMHGKNGIVINGSANDYETTKKIKDRLEDMGYETKMIFVNTSNEVSKLRNSSRGSKGGRELPENKRALNWSQAQELRIKFEELFGKEDFIHFDNSEDLTGEYSGKSDLNKHSVKHKELSDIRKVIEDFVSCEPKHDIAKYWIDSSSKKMNEAKSVDKEELLSPIKHPFNSRDSMHPTKMSGLDYYGFGRYGKQGKVTHFFIDGKLVNKPSDKKTPKSKSLKTIKENRKC